MFLDQQSGLHRSRGWKRARSSVFICLFIGSMLLPLCSEQDLAYGDSEKGGSRSWVGSWTASPQFPSGDAAEGVSDRTVRMIVRPHEEGNQVRLRFSNAYGEKDVTFAEVRLAEREKGAAIDKDTDIPVTFAGRRAVTLSPGREVMSDPLSFPVKKGEDLAVSVYVSGDSGAATWHRIAKQTSYLSEQGNHTRDRQGEGYTDTISSWFWLTGLDVGASPKHQGAVVAFGDSITDGTRSTQDANHRYPDFLQERLDAARIEKSVLNAGISGNKLLRDDAVYGESALKRFDRDVLAQPGVTDVILLEGINDIGHDPHNYDADQIIGAMKQLIDRAHARGLRIYGGTLLPFEGTTTPGYYTEEGEATRDKVNHWIRSSGAFDGVIDFDRALQDPEHPDRLNPAYDSGDHLHPNDTGYEKMAETASQVLLKRNLSLSYGQ
jgi:lysophospholipase L1-like esterase